MERLCRGVAAGAARRHRAPLSPGGQNRVHKLRCKPHDLRLLRREIPGYLVGDLRWRTFHGGDWRAARCRRELRIMPSRTQADDRGRAGSAKSQSGPADLESGSFHRSPSCVSAFSSAPRRRIILIMAVKTKNAKDYARTGLRPETLGTRVLSASAESESSSGSFFIAFS
jgi:hypothetical protein